MQRLWEDYFTHYNFSVWVTPTTPVPATAIDNTEPWTEVCSCPGLVALVLMAASCSTCPPPDGRSDITGKVQILVPEYKGTCGLGSIRSALTALCMQGALRVHAAALHEP